MLQSFFGVTGKYNPVYQHSKGNMKRIVAEVNDLVPCLLSCLFTLICVERSRWVTDTMGETEGFVVILHEQYYSSNRKSLLAPSIKKDTSMLKVRNEIPIIGLSSVRISDQNRHREGTLQMRTTRKNVSGHKAASLKCWSWMHHNHRGKHHNGSQCACFSAVRLSFCPASGSLCCSQCFVTLGRGRWNWHIADIVPSAESRPVMKMWEAQ